MKKFHYSIFVLAFLLFSACTDDEKLTNLPEDFERGTFAQIIGEEGKARVNLADLSTPFTYVYQLVSPENGADVESVDLYVSFDDKTVEEGESNYSTDEVLFTSINASEFDTSSQYPTFTVGYLPSQFLSTLGLTEDQLSVDDEFDFRFVINSANGTFSNVSSNFDNQSADHTLFVPVVKLCPLPPTPGDWTIDMHDSYGDGWQTDDGSGGSGITITLSTGDVIEVGLCNPYVSVDYECTEGNYDGTAVITIPEGIESSEWFFPGDYYGEISFEIYNPDGGLEASFSEGAAAGLISLDYCSEYL